MKVLIVEFVTYFDRFVNSQAPESESEVSHIYAAFTSIANG